jgi:hypothetical protein
VEGRDKIDAIIDSVRDFPKDRIAPYLTKSIEYEMTPRSLEGIQLFQEYCFKLGLLKEKRLIKLT